MTANRLFSQAVFLLLAAGTFTPDASSQCNELVWAEEFDYTGLPDSTKWSYQVGGGGWGNNELQYYTEKRLENARVADGVLTIEARLESYQSRNYTSARLISKGNGDWLYGRIEVRAKLPSGRGTWPAIWMMPSESAYGEWPNSGEIDIMEHVGYDPNVVHATIHTDLYNGAEGTQKGSAVTVPDAFTAFHLYAVEWSPDRLDFYVDNTKYFSYYSSSDYQAWPFDKKFYLIMNIAVGGNWGGVQGVDNTVFPARMEIDYVRIYQDASLLKIQGNNAVYKNEQAVRYSLMEEDGRTFDWSVPEGATIASGQGSNSILVDWGCGQGNVQCHLTTDCSNYDLELPVTMKDYALDGPYFVTDNQTGLRLVAPNLSGTQFTWSIPADANLVSGQGNDTLVFDWGTGKDTVRLALENTCGSDEIIRILRHYGQYPYPDPDAPHLIPGTISPELYDFGGEGVAYHDATSGNSGTGPRSDESVDTEVYGAAVDVGWIDSGEWLEYGIRVQQAGTYYFSALTASQNQTTRGPLKILVNGVTKLNAVTPIYTGSWSSFALTSPVTMTLSPSDTLLRIEMGVGGFNMGRIYLEDHVPTGLHVKEQDDLVMYPVPATDRIFISHRSGIKQVMITDNTGVLRYASETGATQTLEFSIEVGQLPAGMYFLTVTDDQQNFVTRKFIKTGNAR
jgi:beta-glucanase (GH16 family)